MRVRVSLLGALVGAALGLMVPVKIANVDVPITHYAVEELGKGPIKCGRPCVISNEPGGVIYEHRLQAYALLASNTPIIVDGPCASACTLLVDTARKNVCLTTRAVLLFHKGRRVKNDGTVESYMDLHYTPLVRRWIDEQGGLPTEDLLVMPFSEAKRFYKPCPGAES